MSKDTFHMHKRPCGFTMVHNDLISNPRLSWAAKGVLIYLMSKPEGWKVYRNDIVQNATNGIESVKSILKELRAEGYMTLTRVADKTGKVLGWRYDVYDTPLETPMTDHIRVTLQDDGAEIETQNAEGDAEETSKASDEIKIVSSSDLPEAENPLVDETANQSPQAGNTLLDIEPGENSEIDPENSEENPKFESAFLAANFAQKPQAGLPHVEKTPYSNKDISKTEREYPDREESNPERQRSARPAAPIAPTMPPAMPTISEKEFEEVSGQLKRQLNYEEPFPPPRLDESWPREWIFMVARKLAASVYTIRVDGRELPKVIVKEVMLCLSKQDFAAVREKLPRNSYLDESAEDAIFTALWRQVTGSGAQAG